MAAQTRLFPYLPERIKKLEDLAENLWWSWNPSARMLFKMLNRQLWKETNHNPDKMLRDLPNEILAKAAQNPEYLRDYDVVISRFNKYLEGANSAFSDKIDKKETKIVYFSAEYGLHHSLPFYAGGLGFLAGDYIKECSDLRVPLVSIGFMYPQGYLFQKIREDGWQEHADQEINREQAPISRVVDKKGQPLVVQVPLFDPPVFVTLWEVRVGCVTLYLMDTDIDKNDPWNRNISARLYTGDIEQRLRQEIVLGIGGSEVLEKLGIQKSVIHLNEGHAAFAQLDRIKDKIAEGNSFDEAVNNIRKTSVFTTHTPVPAGHDVFPFELMDRYFQTYWQSMGLDRDRFLQLGTHPSEPQKGFNMTAFAMRMAEHKNGVSRKHGEVSRKMWQVLWPDKTEDQVSIGHITNGVHVPTWINPKLVLLFNRYLGTDWMESHDDPVRWELVDEIPDDELWKTHYWLKTKLIDAIRERARKRWMDDHISPSNVLASGTLLDPSVLTLGFARRFATYKRADLIFFDPEKLYKLLNNRWRPIQIIFAGKAHPADDPGKLILQRIFNEARNPVTAGRIAFVENYGEQIAQYMVHGVDIWLNTPVPPMEASGTSGMKAALNGVPNLSIKDGWWLEGYNGENGWAFGDELSKQRNDSSDATELYRLLEEKIIPMYYQTADNGTPAQWVRIMKNSIKSNGARFSARRMVKEYIENYYLEAIKSI
ncbi:alpha-glucan family phosphorylase [bacterium]|nr:alpha-glucan family phosphorylase [bacterium]